MTFFLAAWWISIVVIILLLIISYSQKDKILNRSLDRIISFLAVFQLFLLMITLLTKDPLFEAIGLPKEYEWIGGLFISLFLLWQFYLSPLKERVIGTEKDVREIKTDVKNIKDNVEKISNKFR